MKQFTLFILLCSSLSTFAADWDLLQPHKESFYCVERNGSNFISRYQVDSVEIDNTVNYLINMKYREELFTACPIWDVSFTYGTSGQVDLLTKDIINIDQGIQTIDYGSLVFQIDVLSEVGESVNSGDYVVECLEKENASFLGTTDSIKVYSITSSTSTDTLVLSKNHGIIEGPYFFDMLNGMSEISRIALAGTTVNSTFEGNRSDDIIEYFPYQIGDTIVSANVSTGITPETDSLFIYVTNVVQSGNEHTVYYDSERINVDGGGTITTYPLVSDTSTFDLESLQYDLDYLIHYFSYGFKRYSLQQNLGGSINQVYMTYDPNLEKKKLNYVFHGHILLEQYCSITAISDSDYIFELSHCYGHNRSYASGFGGSSEFSLVEGPDFADSSLCPTDTEFCEAAEWLRLIGTDIETYTHHSISVYPNPAEEMISIEIHGLELSYIELVDINGKVILESAANERTIDINAIPAGIYYLRMRHSEGINVKKLSKI